MLITDELLRDLHARWLRVRLFDALVDDASDSNASSVAAAADEIIATAIACTVRSGDTVTSVRGAHRHAIAQGAAVVPIAEQRRHRRTELDAHGAGSDSLIDLDCGVLGGGHQAAGRAVGASVTAASGTFDAIAVAVVDNAPDRVDATIDAMQIAVAARLPIVFVIGDAEPGAGHVHESTPSFADRVAATGLPIACADGADVRAVHEVINHAVDRARRVHGPCAVDARVEATLAADPLARFEDQLVALDAATASGLGAARDATRIDLERALSGGASATSETGER